MHTISMTMNLGQAFVNTAVALADAQDADGTETDPRFTYGPRKDTLNCVVAIDSCDSLAAVQLGVLATHDKLQDYGVPWGLLVDPHSLTIENLDAMNGDIVSSGIRGAGDDNPFWTLKASYDDSVEMETANA